MFGRWIVIAAPAHPVVKAKWTCRCQCGVERPVKGENLLSGLSKSCGCAKRTRLMPRGAVQRIWAERRIASGICPRCGDSLVENKHRCLSCLTKTAERSKIRWKKRLEAGLCPRCGKKPLANKKHCQECLHKYAAESFGISVEEVLQLRNASCEVCGASGRTVVDHDHVTGRVRGALCNSCNAALGFAKENVETLHRLIDYIKRYAVAAPQELP